MAEGGPVTPVLLLCGPPAVGKSTVGFEVFLRLVRAGTRTAYIDVAQLDFLRSPKRDPRCPNEAPRQPNHELREANLRAIWPGLRDVNTRRLVVSGDVRTYTIPGTTLTVCRLRAGPEQLTERVLARGRGEGAPIQGDELRGRDTAFLHEFARHAVAVAARLDRDRPADLCVDTDGRTVAEVVESVLAVL